MKGTKEHILKISFGLFLQKSFKEVTMKEIVEKTGMSKGAFYHYYESKEQIFLEIIHNAFASLIDVDFSRFSKKSLYSFYHEYISYMDNAYNDFKNANDEEGSFDFNYYSLIFDAIRLFPDFKDKMLKSSIQELEAWKAIIGAARENKEIDSPMSDEQIANIFIHTNSGIGMNNMMTGNIENTTGLLSTLWDGFYAQIKHRG